MLNHDIVIVGGGPAGMAAAVAAYDNGVKDVVILDRDDDLGGILRQCIHNGFGLQLPESYRCFHLLSIACFSYD